MTPILVNLLTFAAVFLTIFAANALLVDLHSSERRRIRKRMEEQHRTQQRDRARTAASMSKDFSQIAAEVRAEGQTQNSVGEKLQFLVEQSGLDITVSRLLTIGAVSSFVMGLSGGLLFMHVIAGVLAAVLGFLVPIGYVHFKRNARLEKLRNQLPDAFDLMSRVLRSGQTITQAMQSVADEFEEPVSIEFLYCYEQMNLGMSPERALRELGRRTGILEIKIFILSVVVHRQAGGNLAELLDKLAHVVRERFRIRGMINSLTAQGRFQAGILLSLPPAMFVLLMFMHREYEMTLFEYPLLIVLALTLMGMGAMWIRKIVNFDF